MTALWQLVGWHFSEISLVAAGFVVAWIVDLNGSLVRVLRRAVTGSDKPADVDE